MAHSVKIMTGATTVYILEISMINIKMLTLHYLSITELVCQPLPMENVNELIIVVVRLDVISMFTYKNFQQRRKRRRKDLIQLK